MAEIEEKDLIKLQLNTVKCLDLKPENLDGMFMKTEKELRLKELPEGTDDKCSICHSSDIDRRYIIGHDVTHCICNTCYQEWIE